MTWHRQKSACIGRGFFLGCARKNRLNSIGKYFRVASHSTELSLIAAPYVTALFALAKEADALDVAASELAQVAQWADTDASLRQMIANPTISASHKAQAMETLLSAAKASDLMVRFVRQVAHNGRLSALTSMHRLFVAQLAEERGELHVEISSAKALSASDQKALTVTLAAATGKTIIPSLRLDPSLIAGVVIRAGSRMLDYSLQGRLRQMALALQPNPLNRL